MSVLDFLKRAVSRRTATPSVTPVATVQEKQVYYSPSAHELFDLIEQYIFTERSTLGNLKPVAKQEMLLYRKIVAGLQEETILVLIRAMKEHKGFDVVIALTTYWNSHRDEPRLREETFFYGVMRDRKSGWFGFDEGVYRLRKAEPEFASCDFSTLDETSRQQALALFRVIMHFIDYKGTTSPDTSSFLRNHPEMTDRVIAFIESRGIGIGSFNTEVFTMAKQSGAQVLDSGVL